MIATAVASFLAACVASMGLTAFVRRIAPRLDLTDRPDQRRKLHERPIALGGGVAVLLATVLVLGLLLVLPLPWQFHVRADLAWSDLFTAFAACAMGRKLGPGRRSLRHARTP